MKIIKFKTKNKFKYKRKVIIKDLILNIFVGIHKFEKRKKQRVRFNIEILTNPLIEPSNKDLSSILNYEEIIKKINSLVKKRHHELLEDLAENILDVIFIVNSILGTNDIGSQADVNEDCSVNVLDIIQIVNSILSD